MGEFFFILALFCLCYQEELTKEWFEFRVERLLDKIQALLLDTKLLLLERDFLVAKYKEMFAEVERRFTKKGTEEPRGKSKG